jgi:L-asparaginase II
MHQFPRHVPLAILTRGGATESVHYGSVAVTDSEGNLLWSAGDPQFPMFTRSSLKPFQAMPVLASGADRAYGFGGRELALMCASHSGEARHVDVVSGMLQKIGCGAEDLRCGKHVPYFYQYLDRTPEPGATFSALHHNCSGKHSGMLTYCRHCGYDIGNYLDPQHPLQQAIRRSVAHFTGTPEAALVIGIDGCSAPNYALPLSGLARAFAKLALAGEDPDYGDAPARLFAAMSAHPELVSGERRNDLALMQTGKGDWATKVGAEGMQGIAVRSRGIGIAIKIADGNARALFPVTVAVLQQLGLLPDPAATPLAAYFEPAQHNLRGIVTGKIQPVVELRGNSRAGSK